jgi:hypothetical protein
MNHFTAHPPTEEQDHPHGCYRGFVFIGHLVEDENGDDAERIEAVPCKRCQEAA